MWGLCDIYSTTYKLICYLCRRHIFYSLPSSRTTLLLNSRKEKGQILSKSKFQEGVKDNRTSSALDYIHMKVFPIKCKGFGLDYVIIGSYLHTDMLGTTYNKQLQHNFRFINREIVR